MQQCVMRGALTEQTLNFLLTFVGKMRGKTLKTSFVGSHEIQSLLATYLSTEGRTVGDFVSGVAVETFDKADVGSCNPGRLMGL